MPFTTKYIKLSVPFLSPVRKCAIQVKKDKLDVNYL